MFADLITIKVHLVKDIGDIPEEQNHLIRCIFNCFTLTQKTGVP